MLLRLLLLSALVKVMCISSVRSPLRQATCMKILWNFQYQTNWLNIQQPTSKQQQQQQQKSREKTTSNTQKLLKISVCFFIYFLCHYVVSLLRNKAINSFLSLSCLYLYYLFSSIIFAIIFLSYPKSTHFRETYDRVCFSSACMKEIKIKISK